MNKKGWGLSEMMFLTGIVLVALIVVGILVAINFKNNDLKDPVVITNDDTEKKDNNNSYDDLENMMITAAKKYIENDTDQNKQEKIIVTLKTLQKEKLIEEIYDAKTNRTKCSGYVIIEKTDEGTPYKPYMKCSFKYTTKDYSAEYDE